jgi:DNA-binding LacI/PurR family transcriptional regulator
LARANTKDIKNQNIWQYPVRTSRIFAGTHSDIASRIDGMVTKTLGDAAEHKRPTMGDVAKKVGVSRQLVGLVFQNAPGVGADTAAKIRAAAKDLGYRPNLAAQSLRRDSSNYIGFMFHADHSSMQGILPAMYRHAKAAGYQILMSVVSESHSENDAIEELIGHRCEGLVLSSSHIPPTRLQRLAREIPLVSLGRRLEKVRGGMVSSNGEAGVFTITKYLIGLGHTDIAYIYGKTMRDADFRLEGYMAAMEINKLTPRVVTVDGDFAERGGARAASVLLTENLPTAIICNNDQSAFGLAHRLLQAGLKIPEQVSVAGYDDTVAKFPFLSLTTIRQDPDALAKATIDDLVARIKGEKTLSETYLTDVSLIVRSSTGKPRRDPNLRV